MLTIKIGRNWCKRKQSFFRWKPLQQRSSGFTISSELTLQKHHVDVVLRDHVVRMVNRVLHSLLVFRPTKELYWIKQQERKRERPFFDQKITSPLIDHILHYSSPPRLINGAPHNSVVTKHKLSLFHTNKRVRCFFLFPFLWFMCSLMFPNEWWNFFMRNTF